MKRLIFIWLVMLPAIASVAQQLPPVASTTASGASAPDSNVTNFQEAFKKGKFQGSFRSFVMTTDNAPHLSDYYAWAAGGSLYFNSASWHGFTAGIGGMFNFNLASSDLSKKDSLTGASNRYEIGLFDVENPQNRHDLDRLEALWLRYSWKNSRITVGKQDIQSPFVNSQDGRMRPTVEAGAWVEYGEIKGIDLQGGWLWKISPRSTVRWYDIGESIGLYPKGLNPDGTGSGYAENLKSAGIGLLGISRQWGKNARIQVWDQYVENIFNTAFVQADYSLPVKNGHRLFFGLQFIHQDAVADGGNKDASKTYFIKGGVSNTVSLQSGWEKGHWQAKAAYTRVTDDGRFLAPREWGREPFYTFMSRERTEGSGDSHAVTGRVSWKSNNHKLRLEVAYGRFYLPDVKNAPLNKYAFPAFDQVNLDARYTFSGLFKGLTAQLLCVRKGRLGNVYNNNKFVINKVDMFLYNLVLNYTY